MGSYKVVEVASGNKFKIQHLETGEICIRHVDDLKKTNMTDTHDDDDEGSSNETELEGKDSEILTDHNEDHEYRRKLRSYTRDKAQKVFAIHKVTENILEKEFYDYVHEMLEELGVDCNSFFR